MIRFIDIGEQIIDGESQFAYYDTVRDEFIGWDNSYVWDSFDDFKSDVLLYREDDFDIERFESITPDKYKKD